MKAIILAAGQSKRLEPLTTHKPKCLLEVSGKAIIDYQIESLRQAGVDEVVVVVGFAKDILIQHLKSQHQNTPFTFIDNPDYGSTYPAYGLWLVRNYLKDEILYLNADVLFDLEIIKTVIEDERESVTAVQRVPWDEEEVNVIVSEKTLEIIEIGKLIGRKMSYGEFIGVSKLGKKFNKFLIQALDYFVTNEELKKFAADAINLAIQRGGTMYASDVTDLPAMEIDTVEDYEKVKKLWAKAAPEQMSQ